jgi:predicted ABC-type exoprotein transport system permease subunit
LGRFVVAFSEEVETMPDDVGETLERVQDRISSNQISFEVENENDTTFNTLPARDFTLTNDEETIFFRLLIANNRLYILALSQPSDLASVETKVSFFNSFQLL